MPELKEAFQHAFTQDQFEMGGIVNIVEALEEGDFDVKVDWVRFEDEESSWEPMQTIWERAPEFVMTELWKLGLSCAVFWRLQQQYGIKP